MGTKERRERIKDEARHAILNAARRLFVRDGYDAVSLRKIAEAAEYSPAAVYLHFRDKNELILSMLMEDFGSFDEEMLKLRVIADPIERIRQIGFAYVRFGLSHPHHYKMMFMTPPPVEVPAEKRAAMDDPSKSAFGLLRAAVIEAMSAGRLHPDLGTDANVIAQMLWAGVHGVTSLQIAMERDPCVAFHDPDGLVRVLIDTVTRGMLRQAASPQLVSREGN